MLEKAYDAKKYEDAIYKKWEESGAFVANNQSDKKPFTISMPPPNATGTLHLGHSVMLALEDIMIRHRRMKGYEVLFLPGTDHAAIATESVVIKNIKEKEGIENPRNLGRETLVQKIADFVVGSQHIIRSQIRKMGTGCDWSREAYTMDASLNRCVNEVFKKMYEDGLIYRGERVVNWDVALQTTLADDEVEHKEQEGILYTFEYLTAGQTGGLPILVSTSRPETKLGDNALAVNPDDERYQHLIGKDFDVVWSEEHKINVTVIADHEVDSSFGSGVLGVTPFHSKIDYDMWIRHRNEIKAEPIQVIDEQGKITSNIPGYEGLSVFKAREKFVEELRQSGRLKEEKKYTQPMAISYRSKKAVEPLPKLQWFIDVNKKVVQWNQRTMSLKEVMLEVVESGQIKILPERFEKVYAHWINNLQDWCVSRQIWWGHRVPVWYCLEENDSCGSQNPIVSVSEPSLCPTCGSSNIGQDADTLDTWFSSALWTWSTLVDKNLTKDLSLSLQEILKQSPDYQKFHPTQVMETGYDIIFFWVARMILMTTYATGKIPFETVYLHGLVRTKDGKKMSKSDPKTCIDPLEMIDEYGADAVRMSMVAGVTPGNDTRLDKEKIKSYRNFTNKLWNASRFVLGIFEEKGIQSPPPIDYKKLSDADEWILGKLNEVIEFSDKALMNYQIGDVSQRLYDFVWNDFCDWYLELSKGDKQNPAVLYYVLQNILKLLHPVTPFVTEQIWSQMPGQTGMLIHESYPQPDDRIYDSQGIELVTRLVAKIRHLRTENSVEPIVKVPVILFAHDHLSILERNQQDIIRLARVSELILSDSGQRPEKAALAVVEGVEVILPLAGLMDPEKEKERIAKEIQNLEKYILGIQAKLSNTKFVQNAPEEIVEAEKNRLKEAEEKLKKLRD